MSDPLREQLQSTLAGAYTIERELGGGGMSRVFVAEESALGRAVVVKVLTPTLAAGVSADRFAREVKLAARLQHPNIVPLLAAGESNGLPYYTMPFVRGESLRARMAAGRSIPIGEAMSVLRDTARALAYAHGEGVVHRDIKPENVLLSGGAAMVADFGIAKAVSDARTAEGPDGGATMLTQEGMSLGTPAYMAPEQATGQPDIDLRADLYAWGVMAWELLAGAHPFAGRSSVPAMIAAHIAEAPPSLAASRPDVPKALADVVMRCLEKDAARRPQSAGELLSTLDAVVTPSSDTIVSAGVPPRRGRPVMAGIAALALLVAAGLWALSRRPPTAPSAASLPTSLAVLPFETVGGDTADAWFAEGIAEELTTALARVPELRLAGRRSAARFSGRTSTVQEIGQALDVGAVLEGSVRRSADRIRVSAELSSAADGRVLWSETYERGAKDVFAVQDDIARAIVGALRVRLGAGFAPGAVAARGTTDLEAYDLYLRGLYLYRRRGAGLADARDLFERAIARDPGFARAHAALASTLLTIPYFLPVRMAEVLPPARAAAERALGLADSLADSHVAMGYVLAESFDWPGAEAQYRRAIALDPASAEPLYRLGNLLVVTGRADEALPVLESLRDRDPLYAVASSFLAWCYAAAGREADALAEGRRALALEPNGLPSLGILAGIYNWAGQRDSAAALARRTLALTRTPSRMGGAAMNLANAGDVAAAEAVTRQIEATPPRIFGREAGLVLAYLGLGDTARALDAMERAAAGDGDLLYTSIASLSLAGGMQTLRDNARFLAVLERYHLDPERFYKWSAR